MNDAFFPARRLLIFDDDPAVAMTIGAIANTVEFETRSATRADDFFRILYEWDPSHIALDLSMPNVDGIEAMRRLGALQCRAEIVITSGMGSRVLDAAKRTAAEHGLSVAGAVSKPFPASMLRSLLTTERAAKATGQGRAGSAISSDPGEIVESQLADGLNLGQLRVVYQPKIECATGTLAGFEALVRWDRPGMGVAAPNSFIPLAERTGLIDRLTHQVLDLGLTWLALTFPRSPLLLSVNLSARSLLDVTLADRIASMCHERALAPDRIILEITETSAMSSSVATLELVTRFRIKGFQLSIDDFGVGFSSLLQLARLPFSELKIDKMFVVSVQESQESRSIIKAIVGLAHSLGLRVTAEGVEDERTLAFLQSVDCDLAQGYFIGRPMASEAIADWIQARA